MRTHAEIPRLSTADLQALYDECVRNLTYADRLVIESDDSIPPHMRDQVKISHSRYLWKQIKDLEAGKGSG